MFRGTFFHNVDDKGRVAIPRKFRDVLVSTQGATDIVITFGYSRPCLDIYPTGEWRSFEAKLRTKEQFSEQTQQFKTLYIGSAHDLNLDSQGRILVPPDLRVEVDLGREVVFTGDLEKFLLWPKSAWEEWRSSVREKVKQPDFFKSLGL